MTAEPATEQISILSLMAVVLRRWKVVAGVTVGVLVLAAAIALLRSPLYTARTAVVPAPSRTDNRLDLLGSRVPAGLAALAIGGNNNQRIVGAIAKSRAVEDSIVRRLARPDGPTEKQLKRSLRKQTDVKTNPDGSVIVEVTDRSPELAAAIARQFPDLINSIAAHLARESALRKREFLEAQIATVAEELSRSEAEMLAFQQESDVPAVEEQAEQTVRAAAELQRGIFELEARITRLRLSATPTNPELRAAESELASRRDQLRRLTGGGGGSAVFVPLRSSPELRLQSMRLLRSFVKNEQVFASLTAALVQTQVEVNENLPVVSVLEEAVPPTDPSSPGRLKLLIVAGVLGMVLGVLFAFVQEFFESARRDQANAGFFLTWSRFRSDVLRLPSGSRTGAERAADASVGAGSG
jgi:tyrosine-protein kinase Etk/Wzc